MLVDEVETFEESEEEIQKIKERYFEENMEKWIGAFEPHEETIATVTSKLTIEQAKNMVKANRDITKLTVIDDQFVTKYNLGSLEDTIDQLIDQMTNGNPQQGCIVKLSCRSAKDVTPFHQRTQNYYPEKLKLFESFIDEDHTLEALQNAKVSALYESTLQCMKVTSGKEALDLLLRSNRISFDLELDLRYIDQFSTHVIVRPWLWLESDATSLHTEFRAFVNENKLTALSQYYTHCYLPQITKNKERVEADIVKFMNEVAFPKLQKHVPHLTTYVIDFVRLDNGKVLVLELNPSQVTTGAGLFDWEADEEVLKGNKPFEFRILQEPVVSKLKGSGQLLPQWEAMIYGSSSN